MTSNSNSQTDPKTQYAHIDVQGHRGARSVLPENTLPAFSYALEVGVDTLEFDLGVTKDNVVVVIHDQQINTVICQHKDGSSIDGKPWVRELTLAQIKQFDCGSRPNPRFPKQHRQPGAEIPTLADVFELVAKSELPNAKTVLFNIETKSNEKHPSAQPSPAHFAGLVLDVVHDYGLQDRVTIQSFDHRTLREVKKQDPSIRLAALFRHTPKNWVSATQAAQADIISPYFELMSKEDIQAAQAAGLKVIPWTANTERDWITLLGFGVDGIITDNPKPLLRLLGR